MKNILSGSEFLSCAEAAALSGQARELFRKALQKKHSNLVEDYIRPKLISEGKSYIYIAEGSAKSHLRNYHPGNSLRASGASDEWDGLAGNWGLFANPLAWVDPNDKNAHPPKDRAINVGFCVYTVEFDSLSIETQSAIIYEGKLKEIDQRFQIYKDYRGYEAVYGGKKSLHFHFVFDLRHWKRELASAGKSQFLKNWTADFPDRYLRDAYNLRWEEAIKPTFMEVTGLEEEPDGALARWEQSRRLPMGLRLIDKDHPLGLREGLYVRQYVLASAIRVKAPAKATCWFHDADALLAKAQSAYVTRQSAAKRRKTAVTLVAPSPEQTEFDRYLKKVLPRILPHPDLAFSHCEWTEAGPKLYFFNHEDDKNPSSYIEGNYQNIVLQGLHWFQQDKIHLGISPNGLLQGMIDHKSLYPDEMGDPHPLEDLFRENVYDLKSHRKFLTENFYEAIEAASVSLILGPEGCGKSHAAMANIHDLTRQEFAFCQSLAPEETWPNFFSSPSYAQTQEKIRTFKKMYPDGPYVPYEYVSISKLYERITGKPISVNHVYESGCASVLAYIYEHESDVYKAMVAYRDKLYEIKKAKKLPVLFGVHETLRRHANGDMTRLFYAKNFDEDYFDTVGTARDEFTKTLMTETEFRYVVLDEVSAQDLATVHPKKHVEWARQYWQKAKKIPVEKVHERYLAFKSFIEANPLPTLDDDSDKESSQQRYRNTSEIESAWSYINTIRSCDYQPTDLITIKKTRLPFDDKKGMYAKCVGRKYYVSLRGWWHGFSNITLLTTEHVAASIIEVLKRRTNEDGIPTKFQKGKEPYRVFRFDEEGLDTVTIETHDGCKKQTLRNLARAYADRYPEAVFVSDIIKSTDDYQVVSHVSARGSNELADRDIIAFYTAPSTNQFCELTALETYLDEPNLMPLWYADRFNQTTGRNRGFRKTEKQHIAVMGHRMLKETGPLLCTRYEPVRRLASVDKKLAPSTSSSDMGDQNLFS